MMKKGLFLRVALAAALLGSRAEAQEISPPDVAREIQALKNEMAELKSLVTEQQKVMVSQAQEIETLKSGLRGGEKVGVPAYVPAVPGGGEVLPSWMEGLRMGGDMRLRYEAFEKRSEISRDRNRARLSLRYGIEKDLNEDFTVGFVLQTGSATDPTSTFQSFTSAFTPKDIFISKAFATYHPKALLEHVPHLKKFEMSGGKTENPFGETSGRLLWDPDVRPEGVYEKIEGTLMNDRVMPFANFGQFVASESGTTASDAELFGYQGGLRFELGTDPKEKPATLTSAVAYYDYTDVTRSSNFIVSGTSLARGNTTAGSTELAARDFNILSFYEEFKFKLAGFPVKLYGEYDINLHEQATSPDGENQAFQIGTGVGSAKKRGDWWLGYYYAYIEPNSVLGAFSESDFGEGHADEVGSNLEASYMLTDFLKFRLKASFTERLVLSEDETGRYQADLEWKF
jgi:hypothetical protein